MVEKDSPVGTIEQMNILQNKYIIQLNGGYKWTFKILLFIVFYKGASENGVEVQVRMQQRHDTWHVQIPSNVDNLRLVAAFAFLHREQQR